MSLLDIFWTTLWVFLFIAWIWVIIGVISDVFRSDELSGWGKAFWMFFVIVIPWLGVLIYLIARGDGMARRSAQAAADADSATRAYIQSAAGTGVSTADELSKLAGLRDSDVISVDEFNAQKAKLLG